MEFSLAAAAEMTIIEEATREHFHNQMLEMSSVSTHETVEFDQETPKKAKTSKQQNADPVYS